MSDNDKDIQYDLLSLDGDIEDIAGMLNVLAEPNLTNVEVRNWVENDEDLLPLEEADGDEPEVNEHDGSELDNQNKTVKNAVAAKSLNLCLKWAEENDIPLNDILVLQRLK
ncbi:uncharacterized protein LOC130896006 [Diorhabda carinulata]|uniref:uncharacterized protein LOC130896006 n=1 Tax=Diorhabda carinulata TaxID=1163345 RepID=UPI0025A03C1C|nr:uncharacterized protein LOC130896006 [Diorhabda carinulata]